MKTFRAPDAVVDEIGLEPLRQLTGRKDIRVCWNWKERGFPPDTYWVVKMELKRRGFKVDPKVFGMDPKLVPEDA